MRRWWVSLALAASGVLLAACNEDEVAAVVHAARDVPDLAVDDNAAKAAISDAKGWPGFNADNVPDVIKRQGFAADLDLDLLTGERAKDVACTLIEYHNQNGSWPSLFDSRDLGEIVYGQAVDLTSSDFDLVRDDLQSLQSDVQRQGESMTYALGIACDLRDLAGHLSPE